MLDLSRFDGHTPGPWHLIPGEPLMFGGSDVVISEHVDDAIVCSMGHDLPGVEANGRLLAAAPSLLSELREARAENERLREALEWAMQHAEWSNDTETGTDPIRLALSGGAE